ncbi:Flp pilus assembly protein CpaB [Enterocloster sp. OA13]|uniref:Flp pilus assembly protein CpaB n=1 Tax=Enterocloster sp. OA13 TaxID=2914161 RepID=UPI00047215B9|nr:Flp pilus assembly protein CpaB [Enterocloster sp. OA13]
MKMNNRFIYGILSIVLAAIIAFVAIPAVTRRTSSTTQIVRVVKELERGQQIKAEDLELTEVGGFNLPENVAVHIEDVAGAYAAAAFMPGDYILSSKVSAAPLSSDPALYSIPDGMVAISVTTQTLATGLSDKLQSGDIIRFYHYDNQSELMNPVADIPELNYVKVLSVTDSKGLDIDYSRPPDEEEEKLQTATITVLATPEQAMLLTRYENEGVLHVALISRGNDALAKELLERQSQALDELYGALGDETPPEASLEEGEKPEVDPDSTENQETESSTEPATEKQPVEEQEE